MDELTVFTGAANAFKSVTMVELAEVPNLVTCRFDDAFRCVSKVEMRNGGKLEQLVKERKVKERQVEERKVMVTKKEEKGEKNENDFSSLKMAAMIVAGCAYLLKLVFSH